MKPIKYLLVVVLLLTLYSCKDKTTNPVEKKNENPPGYQEDIDWPSLADSPWPMSHHDPQSSGRSKYVGPKAGIVEWINDTTHDTRSGIAIGLDSTIYYAIGGSTTELIALNPDGNIKWRFNMGSYALNTVAPLITSDNRIVCSDGFTKIYCVDLYGNKTWEFDFNSGIKNTTTNIDKEGNIYFFTEERRLISLNKEGEFLWDFYDERIDPYRTSQLTFSTDGKTLYIPGEDVAVLSFNIVNKQINWTYGNSLLTNAPVVDSYDRIYLLINENEKTKLVALNPDGTVLWKYVTELQQISDNTPAIDKNGNIYFAADTLYSLNFEGKLRWKKDLQKVPDVPLICDVEGNVFVGMMSNGITIEGYDTNGNLLWQINEDAAQVGGSPAITADNSLIYPVLYNKILKIK